MFSKSERPLPVITMIPACAHQGASFQDGGDGDNFTGPAESQQEQVAGYMREEAERRGPASQVGAPGALT